MRKNPLVITAVWASVFFANRSVGQDPAKSQTLPQVLPLNEEAETPLDTFKDLLSEYKKYTECYEKLNKGMATYDDVDTRLIAKLSAKVLQARFKEFNVPFRLNRRIEQKLARETKILKSRLDKTPLSDYGRRAQMEVNYRAFQDQYKIAKSNLCMLSVQANSSVLDAIETLKPEDKKVPETLIAQKAPKMPFRVLESRAERILKPAAEKPNLSPVDDEFYKTQLGKKLEADLGGRADYWSYDFDKDELYVSVNNEVAKVMVMTQGPGVRFMRTRVGQDFVEPRGSDTRVDLTSAKGKFLTGEAADTTLFGPSPESTGVRRPVADETTPHKNPVLKIGPKHQEDQ